MLRETRKATREHTKIHNSRLVLKMIYTSGEISRADIARQTRLTPTTVSNIVTGLIERGLVKEVGVAPSGRGKPPTLVSMVDDAYHLIGLDLARSVFQGAVMNLRGEVLFQAGVPIDSRDGEAALALVYELIDQLLPATDRPVLGIGIGASGIIDTNDGRVLQAVNFNWYDLPLQDLLRERYGVPVHISNDNDVSALAEYTYGRYKNNPELVIVAVGYGIGAGIIINHQAFSGHGFGAGEIGHVSVVEGGERCRCGNYGCLETVASSRAIVKRAQELARVNPDSALLQFAPSIEAINIDTVIKAFEAGDEALQALIAEVAGYLGASLASVVGILSVPYILIAGSVTGFGQRLLDLIQDEIDRRSLAASVSKTRVEFASFKRNSVILGTAALLLSRELGVV